MDRRQDSLKCDFDSSRTKWTFGSGSLLCQTFRSSREETAWKRRRIETSLVFVIVMLHVLTYVVSDKLFWNWNGAMRFVSQEVLIDEGFVICHFLNYYWSWNIFTIAELVDRIRNFKSNTSQNDKEEDFSWKRCSAGQFFTKKNSPQARLVKSVRRRPDFWSSFDEYFVLLMSM